MFFFSDVKVLKLVTAPLIKLISSSSLTPTQKYVLIHILCFNNLTMQLHVQASLMLVDGNKNVGWLTKYLIFLLEFCFNNLLRYNLVLSLKLLNSYYYNDSKMIYSEEKQTIYF